MRGKKQIAAVVLAVIFAVTAGMPHSTVYAEPDSTGNAQAADAAADDTQKEEKKEEDMTPEELENRKKMISLLLTMAFTCGMFMPAYATSSLAKRISGFSVTFPSPS